MIQAEFFFELLVRLFTDPAGLDGASKLLDRGVAREVGQVILESQNYYSAKVVLECDDKKWVPVFVG